MDIYVRDTDFNRIGIVDTIESIIWTDRYQGYGSFELYTSFTPELLTLLLPDRYLNIKDSDRTMIVESVEIKTDAEKGNKFIVRGRDLLSILDRRLIFQRQIYDNVQVQDVVWDILFKNGIDSPGQPQRNIPGLTFVYNEDPNITTPTMTAEYYTEEVYETIRFLCERTGFGYKMILSNTNAFEFSLYLGVDRSYAQSTNPFVVFSPTFDNLISSDYFYSKQTKKTIALISGDAYNPPRPTFDFDPWENDPNDPHYPTIRTGLERRELFVDAPDLSKIDPNTNQPFSSPIYVQMMYERARQSLNENVAYDQFSGEASTTFGYKYGVDFLLGDIVQLEDMFGNTGRVRITEMTISENNSGIFALPTYEKV
jgi:hypothetical protein